jgi:hypothetical protein
MAARGGLGDIMQAITAFVDTFIADCNARYAEAQWPGPEWWVRVTVAFMGGWMITSGVQLIIKDYQMTNRR